LLKCLGKHRKQYIFIPFVPGPMPDRAQNPVFDAEKPRSTGANLSYRWGLAKSLVKREAEVDLDKILYKADPPPGMNGDYIKALVFGGLDGIITTFALATGLAGADVPVGTLIGVAMAKVFADAYSMGHGEFASSTAEIEHVKGCQAKAYQATQENVEGEVKKLCQIYTDKGLKKEDALTLMTVLAKNNPLLIDHMMVMGEGVMPPDCDDRWQPLKQGIVCFCSFVAFGMLPLLGFIVVYAMDKGGPMPGQARLIMLSYCITASTLFGMGVTKAKLVGQDAELRSGFMMVLNGTIAGGASYLVGDALVSII